MALSALSLPLLADMTIGEMVGVVGLLVGLVILIVIFTIIGQFASTWVQAFSAKAGVSFLSLIGMRLRRVDIRQVVTAKITAVQAGLGEITTNMLESHYLARGNVPNVIRAMIAAHRASIPLDWSKAAGIDLAGRDVLDAVQTSVNPKVIDVPNASAGRQTIDAVAKDGIQLRVKARVTVRTNIQQLIGGATEETVIARVGEGIVTAIGSSDTYKHVMENPDSISKTVLHKGLDAGTAFEILSIDIADIDVGENVGANLQAKQAEADVRRFQAEAEKRRALAIATEQENKALAQLNRAKVIEAEAQIPMAMAEAFRAGHLGIMDYYKMRNIQADTSMRESLGTTGTPDDNKQPARMLFTSLIFVCFFAVVLPLYYLLNHRWQNRMLMAASCVFYGAWSLWFLGILLVSVFVDYSLAHRLHDATDDRRHKWLVAFSCIINLGALAFFKYAAFIAGSGVGLLNLAGFHAPPVYLHILLPVGISFYTFHSMSYIIDIYRRALVPLHSFVDYALYVLYFPQLVAGPIARAHELLPQFHNPRTVTYDHLVQGGWLILWGFFKKLVIADNLGLVADNVFNSPSPQSGAAILVGIYAFAFQIYGDFSGYTDIARGIGKLMGINLAFNFNLPYLARNPADFWRRWHISLSTWLRDYLYIPLGGNRHGTAKTYRNLLLTMLLGGLWHGAAWHFVAWGAYHGSLLAGHRAVTGGKNVARAAGSRFSNALKIFCMFQLTCLGWLFFRATDLHQVGDFLTRIVGQFSFDKAAISLLASLIIWVALLWIFEAWIRNAEDPRERVGWNRGLGVFAAFFLFAAILLFTPGSTREFIYFQF